MLRRAFDRAFSSPVLAFHDNLAPTLHSRVPYRCRGAHQALTKSPIKFAVTVSLASVRPLAAISSIERRMRIASG